MADGFSEEKLPADGVKMVANWGGGQLEAWHMEETW